MKNNIEFKRQLKRLLESTKNRETLKRLIKEEDEQTCSATYGKDPTGSLTMACTYDCFKAGTTMKESIPNLPGGYSGPVALSPSTKHPGYELAVLVPFDPSSQQKGQLIYTDKASMSKFKIDGATNQPFIGSWSCKALTPLLMNTYNPEVKRIMDLVQEYTKGQVLTFQEGKNKPLGDGYKSMTLQQAFDTILQDKQMVDAIKAIPGVANYLKTALVYVQGAKRQFQGDRTGEDVKAWTTYGYAEGPCKFEDEAFCTQIDLSDCKLNTLKDVNQKPMCSKYTAGQFFVHQNMEGREKQIAEKLKTDKDTLTQSNYDKEACKAYLQSYVSAYEGKVQLNQRMMTDYKYQADQCINAKYNLKTLGLFGGLQKKIEGMQYNAKVQGRLGNITDYSLSANSGSSTPVRESLEDRKLKSLIRESLLDVKRTKKKINLAEGEIINNRIKLISEHRTLKTRPQKDKFFNELMMEMAYLNSQGYDSRLINENFLDMLKGLFGTAADSTLQYFKETIAKWLIEKITPMDPNGWMANIIIAGVGNVPIGEITRLTECNYLSDVLSKSIVEGAVNKYKNEQGLTGPFYDILRNGVIEMLEDTKFGQVVEHAIGELVCPLLGGIKDKMGSAADSMKKGALSLT